MSEVTVRAARPGDGAAIGSLSHDSATYYRELAPDDFRVPDADGRAEWLDSFLPAGGEREIALVAEIDGDVVGYLEARLEEPLDSARFQANPELAESRLFVDALLTARSHWRRGVGSALVEAAETWVASAARPSPSWTPMPKAPSPCRSGRGAATRPAP